jgi:hypothetical protein
MRTISLMASIFLSVLLLSGCLSIPPSAISQYDSCAAETKSFVAMAECGKQRRNASCEPMCSSQGNALVQMADALAMSVKSGQMTEGEALRRWAEYKTNVIQANNRTAAIAAASGPVTCNTIGTTVTCY